MFGNRYFGVRYFPDRYFGQGTSGPGPGPGPGPSLTDVSRLRWIRAQ